MTTLGHAVNQASARRLVARFTYTPKQRSSQKSSPQPKSLRIAKAALDTLNVFVAKYVRQLYRQQPSFHLTMSDNDRLRLEQTWLNTTLKLEEGIPATLIRKQIEQHLTHALVAACNTTLDCKRATVSAHDLLRPLMLLKDVVNVTPPSTPPS
jgi:hypothetical protein